MLHDITNIPLLQLQQSPRRTLSDPSPISNNKFKHLLDAVEEVRPMHSHLIDIERMAIVILKADGQDNKIIAAKVNCSVKSVRRWSEAFEDNGEVLDAYKCGRNTILDEEDKENIVQHAIDSPKKSTPKQIKRDLDLHCSPRTIRRVLDDAGLFGRIARVIPPASKSTIQKRLSFANGYSTFNWNLVLWSDEMSIRLGPQGQTWVQRPIGEAWNPEYCVEKEKHPPKVHVWGCMASAGVGDIHVFTENLDKELMKKILSDHLIKSARQFWPIIKGIGKKELITHWWFQQDNDPKHSSRLVQNWLNRSGIDCIDWPPYSPDLNPIENLWANLKKRVENDNPKDVLELENAVRKCWTETDNDLCRKLVNSMPNRLDRLLEYGGGPTGY